MRLDQFDKLQVLIRELIDKTLLLKQANYRLNEENEKLKAKIEQIELQKPGSNLLDLSKLKEENKQLRIKNNQALERLEELIGFVEQNVS
jgi:hypothetical protein